VVPGSTGFEAVRSALKVFQSRRAELEKKI
jgi:hypothetical protein